MPRLCQVVLQLAWQYLGLAHRQSSGSCQTQGSHLARRESPWRDHTRVLQLWQQERFHAWIYSGQK
jgi:hypothetical protein